MTNEEKLKELFPDIPEHSGIDYWGDFWDEEYKDPKGTMYEGIDGEWHKKDW
jgi:hypothetical protein